MNRTTIVYTMTGVFAPKPDEEFLNLICQEDSNYKGLLQLWLNKNIMGKRYTMRLTLSNSFEYISFEYEIKNYNNGSIT